MSENKTLELLSQIIDKITDNQSAYEAFRGSFEDIKQCVQEEIELTDISAAMLEDACRHVDELYMELCETQKWFEAVKILKQLYSVVGECIEKNPFFITPKAECDDMYHMADVSSHYHDDRYLFMHSEFQKFWDKIERQENFALLRWGDGERAILTKEGVKAQEGWSVPQGEDGFGDALSKALAMTDEKVYHGISCPCCDAKAYYWYLSHTESKQLTFANLWVNSNYQNFIGKLGCLKRDAVVIGNAAGRDAQIGGLNTLDYYEISDDCLDFFYHHLDRMIEEIISKYGSRNNLFYAISAGPLSEIIIERLFQNNPENCYIDFGSCVDIFIHKQVTRPYMIYQYPECFMHNPKRTNTDITVVMSLYKRPEVLLEQLEAVENQTLKPKEIILFQDRINGYYQVELSEEIKRRFSKVHICTENVGVWGRFQYAKEEASCPYVCVLDDDTIPGKRWLENCHIHMNQEEAVYGTIGIILNKNHYYPGGRAMRIGWGAPRQRITEVDFAGHIWFVKKEYLNYLFDDTENIQRRYKYVAEDITLSVQCKKHEIRTIIPVHYWDNQDFWGSIPEIALKNGQKGADISVSADKENLTAMNFALLEWASKGWKSIVYESERYVQNVFLDVADMEGNRRGWGDEDE